MNPSDVKDQCEQNNCYHWHSCPVNKRLAVPKAHIMAIACPHYEWDGCHSAQEEIAMEED